MSTPIKIHPVRTRRDLKSFIDIPWLVNRGNPYWVPPLRSDRHRILNQQKHPFYIDNKMTLFIARRNGRPLGRIAAIYSPEHCRRSGEACGMFGFLEAIEDEKVFAALLHAAEVWLAQYGCQKIIGPISPSTNYELGFLIDGFGEPPFLMLAYNPAYYDTIMKTLGFQKLRDFYAYYIDPESLQQPEKLRRIQQRVRQRTPVKIRSGRLRNFDAELDILRDIYNDAWEHHWGFLPMSAAEFKYMGEDLHQVLDPELVLIAEYKGEAVGFLLALPNFNEVLIRIPNGRLFPGGLFKILRLRKKIRGVRVITLGVKQKFQNLGLGSIFYAEISRRIIAGGYTHAEMSWVMEDNVPMNSAARLLGGKRYKTYRLYEKHIG